ncbi:MAG: M6 family metalloprotease domain-containing protein [Promethearchaeota archaeon]
MSYHVSRKLAIIPAVTLMTILLFSLIAPLAMSIFSAPLTTQASSATSMPMSSRIGLDGPPPLEVYRSSRQVTGTKNLVAILVEFPDKGNTFTSAEVETNALAELNDYIDEVSYGLVSVGGDATQWYTLSHNRAYYVDGTSFPSDPKFDIVSEAIALADPDVDFSNYDGVTIIHAGQGQELSHDWQDYWSSEWWGFTIWADGISIQRASVSPEESLPGEPSFVGVLAHEFGHDLGLPDLYDVDYQGEQFVGHWGLMGAGSWNGPMGLGDQPSHMMGWSKSQLGWVNASNTVEVSSDLTAVIDPLELPPTGIHLIRINVTSTHYFLIEVRKKIGYDTSLPIIGPGGEGVLITEIDETLSSGQGIVKVIDAHPGTVAGVDDGAFDIGLGDVDSYVSSSGQFTMVIENAVGASYNVSIIRAFMEFLFPLDGSAILTPNITIQWSGTAPGTGIDHFELFVDDILEYSGLGTSQDIVGLTSGVHNATLIMELAGSGRRLSIQSQFIVDLADPIISSVSHSPMAPGFGDPITVSLEATDDTWIVNATVYFQRQGDTRWYHIDMVFISGSEWKGALGTFLPGSIITYYVTVTDAGGRVATDDNAGTNYSITISGFGLIIWIIIIAAIALIIVFCICTLVQRRKRKPQEYMWSPAPEPTPANTPSPTYPSTTGVDTPSEKPVHTGFCYHCGAPLTPNATFCGHCGRTVD